MRYANVVWNPMTVTLGEQIVAGGLAEAFGLPTAGLPDFAGYGVGLRIADAHLAASGLTAAASVALPAREVLGNAGVGTAA